VTADRRFVLVSGAPATGKTTLAGPLAAALGFPLLAKDHIKETLHDALHDGFQEARGGGPSRPEAGSAAVDDDDDDDDDQDSADDDLIASRRLGAASMRLLWALAARCPAAVLEANFQPGHRSTRPALDALGARVVEVHCQCPPEEAARRFRERAPGSHPVHVFREVPPEVVALSDRPIAYGPVITVDTTRPTDLPGLVAEIRRVFSGFDGFGEP
jgi:predicted kinase